MNIANKNRAGHFLGFHQKMLILVAKTPHEAFQSHTVSHVRSLTACSFSRKGQRQTRYKLSLTTFAIEVSCRWVESTEQIQRTHQTQILQAMNTELELGREMAVIVSPSPCFTHPSRTVDAVTQMVHLLDRRRHIKDWIKADTLS